jgi:hypothetical protein
MLFDKLWRAQRQSRIRSEKILEQYEADLRQVRDTRFPTELERQNAISKIEADYGFATTTDDEFDVISTRITVKNARKLGIPLPPHPAPEHQFEYGKDLWYFNEITGNTVLTEVGQFQVRQAIRKEQTERLQHRMRYVSLVGAPIVAFLSGLIGALVGYFAVRHSIR